MKFGMEELKAPLVAIALGAMLTIPGLATAEAEVPSLKAAVEAGKLPPVAERLPANPMQIDFATEGKEPGKYGGELQMLMGRAKDIGQMTVYSYARVVGYGPDYRIHPDIVESFEIKEGREFTFTLREGHKWSDGHPLTSEDFRYFWEDMIKNPDLGRKGVPQDMLVDGEEPTFEVIDERTFKYSWSKPNPAFLPALAAPSPLYIYRPAHYMKQFHTKYSDPAKLEAMAAEVKAKDWASLHTRKQRQRRPENPDLPTLQAWWNKTAPPSTRFIFERNPFYHRVDSEGNQLPYIDRVIMNIVSKEVIPAKTGTGESDLQARYLRFDHVPFLKQGEEDSGKFKTFLWSVGRGSQVALFPNLNVTDPEWRKVVRDVRFRRALSMAINRDEINESVYFGLASPSANTVLPQSQLFKEEYKNAWIAHDPGQANSLLDEMGLTERNDDGIRLLPDGRPMEITIESGGESTEQTDVLELISSHVEQVGIKLFVRASQRDIFRRRIYSGEAVVSVFDGFNNALAGPEMSPEELAPTAEPQLQWPMWGKYSETGGKAGEAVDMPEAAKQLELYNKWLLSENVEEKTGIWQEMLANYTDQVFNIGTVNNSRQPVVVSIDLKNVPEEGVYAWEPTSYFGTYRPDTFWFDR